jgi:hypothetical protein
MTVEACGRCDEQGYLNGKLCPHTDKFERAAARGMAKVREVLAAAHRKSAKATIEARNEAYNRSELVKRQRESGPPVELPPEEEPTHD